ncbi:MAG: PAS domain S-box protein, partial [Anaerolineales bacterium]
LILIPNNQGASTVDKLSGALYGFTHLEAAQPFWQTWWFIAVGILILTGAILFGVQWWLQAVNDNARRLETLVEQRTSALREANDQLKLEVEQRKRAEAELAKRAADKLEQSEARFRAAFESSAIGIGLLSLDGRILAVNAAVSEMSGFTEDELLGRNDNQNVYPPDLEIGQDLYAEMLAGTRNSYSIERRYLRKSGEIFWTRLTLSLVRNSVGEPDYLVGLIEDIDDEKRKAEALIESEARFRTMFETSAVGIGMMGLDGKLIDANPALCQMYGYSCEELIGQTAALVTHPDDLSNSAQHLQSLLTGRYDHYTGERRYIRKNGEMIWAQITMSMVRDAQSKPLYIVGILTDITEKKRMLDDLRRSQARFQAVFENAAVGIAVMGLDRKPIAINPVTEKIIGYELEELKDVNPRDLAIPEDRSLDSDMFPELIAGKRNAYVMERRYRRKNGEIFWARINYSLVRDLDGNPEYLVGMIEDIDDQKRASERLATQETEHRRILEQRIAERTEELNKANELLQQKAAQEAVTAERTRLARDLHDAVTQTLFSATLIADVLPDIWSMNEEEGQRRLGELRQLTRGALAEMRTLLVELRPNALVEVPLPTLLRQLSEALTGRARIDIQFSSEGERVLPSDVQIAFYRIAQEALNNVVKHSKASQAAVMLRLGEQVRLSITDDGAGFDPSSVTADHLGLKIMCERSDAIGAKFNLYSEPGEGTQVTVTWQV